MTDATETPKPEKRRRRMAREPKIAGAQHAAAAPLASEPVPSPPKPASKTGKVLELLQRSEGATIAQLSNVTGWLPHTTRAALTGLKKKGLTVTSSKIAGEERIYRVAAG